MEIKTINGTYNSNTYVCQVPDGVLIVDSGADLAAVQTAVAAQPVLGILVTHEHFDHLTNCAAYARAFHAPIYAAKEVLDNLKYYRPQLPSEEEPGVVYPIAQLDGTVDFHIISDETALTFGATTVQPLLCPGHSPGSVVYLLGDALFTGDVLFNRGIGNSTFMTNGRKYLRESLERLLTVPFVTAYHGHWDPSDYQSQQKNIRLWLKWLSR